ncbi:MAG: hypothetical protein Q4P08_04815 [Eubacteriales bacterium]|nr:hypothetical protein [Eubacteriales bacterium]
MILREDSNRRWGKFLHLAFLLSASVALLFLAQGKILFICLGLPLILILERSFSERKNYLSLAFGLPLSCALLALAKALVQILNTFVLGNFYPLPLLLILCGCLFLKPLRTPRQLRRLELTGEGFFQDEPIQLWILCLLSGLVGLLYLSLRPLGLTWDACHTPAWEICMSLIMLSLFLVIYYFDECFQAALGQRRLSLAEDSACQLYKAFLSARLFPDVPPESWPKVQQILAEQSAEELAEFQRVLVPFLDFASGSLRRHFDFETAPSLVFELKPIEAGLRFQLFGNGVAKSPQPEDLEAERKSLADLQIFLRETKSRYFEEELNGRRRMVLEIRAEQPE